MPSSSVPWEKDGLGALRDALREASMSTKPVMSLRVPVGDGKLAALIYRESEVLERATTGGGRPLAQVRADRATAGRLVAAGAITSIKDGGGRAKCEVEVRSRSAKSKCEVEVRDVNGRVSLKCAVPGQGRSSRLSFHKSDARVQRPIKNDVSAIASSGKKSPRTASSSPGGAERNREHESRRDLEAAV